MENILSRFRVHLRTSRVISSPLDFIARERSLHTIEFRDFKPEVILSMQKRALIRRIGLYHCRDWAQHLVDRWRDVVSSPSSPSASDDFGLLPYMMFPLTSYIAVLMCHLALFSFYKLMKLTLPRSMVGENLDNKRR